MSVTHTKLPVATDLSSLSVGKYASSSLIAISQQSGTDEESSLAMRVGKSEACSEGNIVELSKQSPVKRKTEIVVSTDNPDEGRNKRPRIYASKRDVAGLIPLAFPSPKCVADNSTNSTGKIPSNQNNDSIQEYYYEEIPNTYAKQEETEAGLSLLFAASLIQQKDRGQAGRIDFVHDTKELPGKNSSAFETVQVEASSTVPASLSYSLRCKMDNGVDGSSTVNNFNSSESLIISSSNDEINTSAITDPTECDVLCGRGGGINKHIGNIIYRRVVEYNKGMYKQVPKRYRMLVSQSIVQAILNSGGRFLQQQEQANEDDIPCIWKQIRFRRAVQKTSQALRERNEDETSSNNFEQHDFEDVLALTRKSHYHPKTGSHLTCRK